MQRKKKIFQDKNLAKLDNYNRANDFFDLREKHFENKAALKI
jgi:hypothetical protein